MIDITNYWEDDDKFLLYQFSEQHDIDYFGEEKTREWAKRWIHEALYDEKRGSDLFINSAAIIAETYLVAWGI